jgi:hypothetical protein
MRRGSELVALASSGAATTLIMLRLTDGWEQARFVPLAVQQLTAGGHHPPAALSE